MSSFASPWITEDLSVWEGLALPAFLTELPKNVVIYDQNQPAEHFYIVRSGRVLLSVFSSDGVEKILMFAGKGGIFGELCVFDNSVQPCAARTLVNCVLYKIPYSFFREKICSDQKLCCALMDSLMKKSKMLCAQIASLSFRNVYQRVAAELIYGVELYGVPSGRGILIDIPITQQDMGDRIKASRVSVSGAVRKMMDAGIVARKNKRFIILDLEALKDILEE